MRKIFMLSFLLGTLQWAAAQQVGLPDVPKRVDFAGVNILLDVDAQKLVQKEVSALLIPENRYVLDKLQRIQWYFPVIERILELENVPDDFKYLAVVESALLPDAVSSSNAVGFWQMKAPTAQELGLRVDSDIDERKNIYASTKAAAAYLKRNNQIYRNWVSALYSYLLGAGGISKIVPSDWTNASSVQFDGRTDRYLIKTVAARIAFEYRVNRMKENELAFIEYRKGKGKTLQQIASSLGLDAAELKKNNSWLQTNTIPDDYSVALLVPVVRMDEVQSKIGVQPAPVTASKGGGVGGSKGGKTKVIDTDYPKLVRVTRQVQNEDAPVFYEINEKKGILAKPGDDVASLAKAGKLKIKDFLLFNDMSDADVVETGKVYYLQRKYSRGPVDKHEIKDGESMWEVAHMYGVKLKNVLKYNRVKTAVGLSDGQVIYLRKKRPKSHPIEQRKINERPAREPQEKLPLVEKFDQPISTEKETVSKNQDKPVRNTQRDDVNQSPSETVVIERPRKQQGQPQGGATTSTASQPKTQSQPQNVPQTRPSASSTREDRPQTTQTRKNEDRDEDETDIVVITDDDDDDRTDYSTPRPATNPNVSIVSGSTGTTKTSPSETAPKTTRRYHNVTAGENLYSIARKYNVPVRELASWNSIPVTERVKIGQRLVVNNSNAATGSASTTEKKPATTATTRHKVVRGETLFSISKRYGVSMSQIQTWNNMRDRNVKLGQVLTIRK